MSDKVENKPRFVNVVGYFGLKSFSHFRSRLFMTSDLASQSYTAQHSIRPSVRGNSDSGTTVHALNAYLGALDSSGVRKIARHDKLTYHYPATTFISGK